MSTFASSVTFDSKLSKILLFLLDLGLLLSVSLNSAGNIVAIGAKFNDGNGDDSGHVRVYQLDGMTWQKLGNDIDGEAAEDQSGVSVSLNSAGNIVAIGANFGDRNGFGLGDNSGHVRVFTIQLPEEETSPSSSSSTSPISPSPILPSPRGNQLANTVIIVSSLIILISLIFMIIL
jgi:hypothetical protein